MVHMAPIVTPVLEGMYVLTRRGRQVGAEQVESGTERPLQAAAEVREICPRQLVVVLDQVRWKGRQPVHRDVDAAVGDLARGETEDTKRRAHEVADFKVTDAPVMVNVLHPLGEAIRVAALHEQARAPT